MKTSACIPILTSVKLWINPTCRTVYVWRERLYFHYRNLLIQIKRSFTWQPQWALIWKIVFEARRHMKEASLPHHLSGLIVYLLCSYYVFMNRFSSHTHTQVSHHSLWFPENKSLLSDSEQVEAGGLWGACWSWWGGCGKRRLWSTLLLCLTCSATDRWGVLLFDR